MISPVLSALSFQDSLWCFLICAYLLSWLFHSEHVAFIMCQAPRRVCSANSYSLVLTYDPRNLFLMTERDTLIPAACRWGYTTRRFCAELKSLVTNLIGSKHQVFCLPVLSGLSFVIHEKHESRFSPCESWQHNIPTSQLLFRSEISAVKPSANCWWCR